MNLLITGCGSLATAFTKAAIDKFEKIVIYSRDWQKHVKLKNELNSDKLRFFVGDISDLKRLNLACKGIDYILHTAAIKDLGACNYNCMEAAKTNIMGTQNIIEAAIANEVIHTVFVSSDKAVSPINSYGISKAMGEKLIVNANFLSAGKQKFNFVRYGNIAGSSGSIIPKFLELKKKQYILPLTNLNCTRFWFDMDDAIKLIIDAFCSNSNYLIPKMKSFYIRDLIKALGFKWEIIGLKKDEKIHEEIEPGISSKDGPFMTQDEIREKLKEFTNVED